jgi:RNA recognition motif-containing protein
MSRAHVAAQRIFVVGFGDDVNERGLASVFAPYGDVPFVQITRKGAGRAFGFVDLSPPSAATIAIEDLNRSLLNGRRLTVQRAAATSRGKRAVHELVAELDDPEIEALVLYGRELLARRSRVATATGSRAASEPDQKARNRSTQHVEGEPWRAPTQHGPRIRGPGDLSPRRPRLR